MTYTYLSGKCKKGVSKIKSKAKNLLNTQILPVEFNEWGIASFIGRIIAVEHTMGAQLCSSRMKDHLQAQSATRDFEKRKKERRGIDISRKLGLECLQGTEVEETKCIWVKSFCLPFYSWALIQVGNSCCHPGILYTLTFEQKKTWVSFLTKQQTHTDINRHPFLLMLKFWSKRSNVGGITVECVQCNAALEGRIGIIWGCVASTVEEIPLQEFWSAKDVRI